ncbi:hypothetical protein F8O07_06870 [Pseudoclavibacter sp. CFCC 13796]|uniref:hypothetical protein n=1 Tax=Pseudoclavibacter sp. CFCC 13796 TaxID=2615179 RepID=UPI00130170DB|nr:hypothetical protein [Pseudoclavibacter sp. CFCC 13796]KAB1661621.1 hypothetical protein F8O07_06870 [Pseudoclavibacter sp. CFCC 13796]
MTDARHEAERQAAQPVDITEDMVAVAVEAVESLDWGQRHGGEDPSTDQIVRAALTAVLGGGDDERDEALHHAEIALSRAAAANAQLGRVRAIVDRSRGDSLDWPVLWQELDDVLQEG